MSIPRLLVIDDLFGRSHSDRRNLEREALCGALLLRDITGDEGEHPAPSQRVPSPIAEAYFFRGQQPAAARRGDTVTNDLDGIMNLVSEGWHRKPPGKAPWAMVLLDLCFYTGRVTSDSERTRGVGVPEGRVEDEIPTSYFGLKVLAQLSQEAPGLPVVVLSSKRKEDVALQYSRLGAIGFLGREQSDVVDLLRKYLEHHAVAPDPAAEIVGLSIPLLSALRDARRMGLSGANVLIRGESGTGKELLGRYLNRMASRGQKRPWVPINCGAIPRDLFESEMFGHVKGSFTGATSAKAGLVSEADGGDLFLDEVGAMDPENQAGLLRVLEDGLVTPVGAASSRKVNVRFIAATDEDIEGRTLAGQFRQPLLERLRRGGTLTLPPLRERLGDLPLLVRHFLTVAEAQVPGATISREIDPCALEELAAAEWPGNIRQLAGVILAAVTSFPGADYLVPKQLQVVQANSRSGTASMPVVARTSAASQATNSGSELSGLLSTMRQFGSSDLASEELAGRLHELQEACRLLALRMLGEAIKRNAPGTKIGRPSADRIRYTNAVRLLAGSRDLSPMQAKRLVRRLFGQPWFDDPDGGLTVVDDDPLIQRVFKIVFGQKK